MTRREAMKITYRGTIVEVGNIGTQADSTGAAFSIDIGNQTITFEGMTGQQVRDVAKHLFDGATITIEIGES
jgi:hypothetical protein